jgi:hypothetical protein
MTPNRRQGCRAAVAEWRAGTEKSPASKPPQSKNCDCHVCLLYLEANPPQPPKPRAKAKPTPSKQQSPKQQSSKQQSWGHSPGSNIKKTGKGKRSRIGMHSASGCAGVGRRVPNAGAGAGAFPGAGVGDHAGAAPPRRERGVPQFRYIPAPCQVAF